MVCVHRVFFDVFFVFWNGDVLPFDRCSSFYTSPNTYMIGVTVSRRGEGDPPDGDRIISSNTILQRVLMIHVLSNLYRGYSCRIIQLFLVLKIMVNCIQVLVKCFGMLQ